MMENSQSRTGSLKVIRCLVTCAMPCKPFISPFLSFFSSSCLIYLKRCNKNQHKSVTFTELNEAKQNKLLRTVILYPSVTPEHWLSIHICTHKTWSHCAWQTAKRHAQVFLTLHLHCLRDWACFPGGKPLMTVLLTSLITFQNEDFYKRSLGCFPGRQPYMTIILPT